MTTRGTQIIFEDSALSSRYNAGELRRSIVDKLEIQKQDYVRLDYTHVQVMSGCYADELFGVLVLELGYPQVFEKVALVNANEHILRTIAEAIKRRLGD